MKTRQEQEQGVRDLFDAQARALRAGANGKGKGPGKGWWGPPKGTHGPGSQGTDGGKGGGTQAGGGGAQAGGGGAIQGSVPDEGVDLHWDAEDTVSGSVVIETEQTGASHDQIASFLKRNVPGHISHLDSPRDIDEVRVLDLATGAGYIMAHVDITPSVDAGERWLEAEEGLGEWETYHEL